MLAKALFLKKEQEINLQELKTYFKRNLLAYTLQQKIWVISDKLQLEASYTKVEFVVELKTNTYAFPVQVRVSHTSCFLCLL